MVRKITINRMVSIGFRWVWSEIFATYNVCTHLNGMQCTLHMFEHGFVWPKTDILESLILMLSLCLQTHHTHIHVDVYCIPLHWSFSSISIRSVRACCGTAVNHTHCMVCLFIVIYNGQIIHSAIIRIVSYVLQTKSLIIIFMEIFWWQRTHTSTHHILARGLFVLCVSLSACVRFCVFFSIHARLHYLMMWIILQFNSSSSILLSV